MGVRGSAGVERGGSGLASTASWRIRRKMINSLIKVLVYSGVTEDFMEACLFGYHSHVTG
jgi:hypothetical protein